MKKEFIPYEQALALKELGFDEPCFSAIFEDKIIRCDNIKNSTSDYLSAPTFSQAFRWFREKYDLYSHIRESLGFDFILEFVTQINGTYVNHNDSDKPINRFETYDEAELECLKKLIELVKDEN